MGLDDKLFIFKKLVRRMAIPFLLFSLLCAFVFTCYFNNQMAFASSNLASLKRSVSVIEGDNVTLLAEDQKMLDYSSKSNLKVNDIDLEFNANTKLEYVFEIQSISSYTSLVEIKLVNNKFENILIEYQTNEEVKQFEDLKLNLPAGKNLCVKIWISIENPMLDAAMNGDIELTIS